MFIEKKVSRRAAGQEEQLAKKWISDQIVRVMEPIVRREQFDLDINLHEKKLK